ncbi:transposase protein, partial [Pseudomonas cannabina]
MSDPLSDRPLGSAHGERRPIATILKSVGCSIAPRTPHCRACPSCGKKATDQWITVQNNRLPDCLWQHLVFTLPDTLWPLFFYNRWLLDALFRLAADNL